MSGGYGGWNGSRGFSGAGKDIGANLRMVFIINPFVVILSEAKNLHNYRHVREIIHCAALRSE
jgi:hypothetical protein